MIMKETYLEILRIVEEVTDVSASEMLTSNCEEHVDARHILVYVLGNRGFSDTKIAEFTKLTRPCVCMIRKFQIPEETLFCKSPLSRSLS